MSRGFRSLFAALVSLLVLGTGIRAEDEQPNPKDAASSPRAGASTPKKAAKAAAKSAAKVKPVSAAREAELLEFVQTHHAELAILLKTLKTAQTKEYAAAVSDLDREIRRLDQIRKRSPAQFDAELNIWVARSRVRLLSARISMSDDEELKEELKARLRELRQLELAALQLEIVSVEQTIEKQRQKLRKLQKRLADLQSSDEDWLAKQMTSLKEKHHTTEKPKKKPAVKAKVKSLTAP